LPWWDPQVQAVLKGEKVKLTPEMLQYKQLLSEIRGSLLEKNQTIFGQPPISNDEKDTSQSNGAEPQEPPPSRAVMTPQIVDIGAGLGAFSLIGASLGFRSIAYEPNPDFAEKFRLGVALNGFYDTITVVEAAVSDQIGDIEIAIPKDPSKADQTAILYKNTTDSSLNRDQYLWKEVQMIRADYSVEWISLMEDIQLLRVSVGGHESRVLKGANNLFKTNRVKAILLRFSAQDIRKNHDEPLSTLLYLADRGFRLKNIADPSPYNMQQEFKRLINLPEPVDLYWVKIERGKQ